MIQITRQLAKQLRAVIKRTFGRQINILTFRASDQGLFIEVQGRNQALRYHDPQPQDPEQLNLPLQVLDDVQGSKAEPVFLNSRRDGIVGASWQENGIFRDLEYEVPATASDAPAFPDLPSKFTANPPALLTAIRDAYDSTDMESKRYALGCVQLRRDGVLAATDGRQMLKQTGFTFGLDADVLVQPTRFFANKELPASEPLRIGALQDDKGITQVVFDIGRWTYWIGTEREDRFPDVNSIIPSTEGCQATLQLARADGQFLVDNLHRLPSGHTHREVTLDLNGRVIVRAASAESPRPAEIILRNSTKLGNDLQICTDRLFLARAARLGFQEIHFPDREAPAVAKDAARTFVWMLLSPQGAVKPTENTVRIESPVDSGHRHHPIPTPIKRQEHSVNRLAATIQPPRSEAQQPAALQTVPPRAAPEVIPCAPAIRRRKSSSGKSVSSLEQAIALRDQLRAALGSSKELIRNLKTEKRGQKSLKLALDSLRQLQKVA